MSTANTLGLATVPRLLPVTGSFLLPLTLLNTFLSLRIVTNRLGRNIFMGDRLPTSNGTPDDLIVDPMHTAVRTHANFLENAPLAILLSAAVELNGGNRTTLAYVLGVFTALRTAHAFGLGANVIPARASGYYGSVGIMTGLGGWAFWLVRDYWGF